MLAKKSSDEIFEKSSGESFRSEKSKKDLIHKVAKILRKQDQFHISSQMFSCPEEILEKEWRKAISLMVPIIREFEKGTNNKMNVGTAAIDEAVGIFKDKFPCPDDVSEETWKQAITALRKYFVECLYSKKVSFVFQTIYALFADLDRVPERVRTRIYETVSVYLQSMVSERQIHSIIENSKIVEKDLCEKVLLIRNTFRKFFWKEKIAGMLYSKEELYSAADVLNMMTVGKNGRFKNFLNISSEKDENGKTSAIEFVSKSMGIEKIPDVTLDEAFRELTEDTKETDTQVETSISQRSLSTQEEVPVIPVLAPAEGSALKAVLSEDIEKELDITVQAGIEQFGNILREEGVPEFQIKRKKWSVLKFFKVLGRKLKEVISGDISAAAPERKKEDKTIISENDFTDEAKKTVKRVMKQISKKTMVLDERKSMASLIHDVLLARIDASRKVGKIMDFTLWADMKVVTRLAEKLAESLQGVLDTSDREKLKNMLLVLYDFTKEVTVPEELKAIINCLEIGIQCASMPDIKDREKKLVKRGDGCIKAMLDIFECKEDIKKRNKAEFAVFLQKVKEVVDKAFLRKYGNSLEPVEETLPWEAGLLGPEYSLYLIIRQVIVSNKADGFTLNDLDPGLEGITKYKRINGREDVTEDDIIAILVFRASIAPKLLDMGADIALEKVGLKTLKEGFVAVKKLTEVLRSKPVEVGI